MAQPADSIPPLDSSLVTVDSLDSIAKPQIRRINGKHSEELMQEAIVHFDGGRYQRCLELLDQAISINDFEEIAAILYYYKAITQTRTKAHEKAILNFDSAIVVDPDKPHYYYRRGEAYMKLKNHDLAFADFTATLKLDPNFPKAYVKRGFIHSQRKEYNKALEDYNKALEVDPESADAYYYRGLLMFWTMKPQEGCQDFEKAVQYGSKLAVKMKQQYCK